MKGQSKGLPWSSDHGISLEIGTLPRAICICISPSLASPYKNDMIDISNLYFLKAVLDIILKRAPPRMWSYYISASTKIGDFNNSDTRST